MPLFAQSEKVIISESKKGKRVVLHAENTTADTLNIFLMVQSEGYRRSADKPVLKDIPPHSKIPMITLIELRDVASSYTYDLIVNETENEIAFEYENEIVDIENVVKGKVVIFAMVGCEKCAQLASKLTEQRIAYRMFNIAEDPKLYRQFMKFVEKELTSETRIQFPVIWNRDHTIFGYEDLNGLIEQFDN